MKEELVKDTARRAGVTQTVAKDVMNAVFEAVTAQLATGDVRIGSFGTFKVSFRDGRVGRNPRTGEAIEIAASHAVKFSAAPALKARVGRGRAMAKKS